MRRVFFDAFQAPDLCDKERKSSTKLRILIPMKPFLILQLRPEAEASDSEFAAFLKKGGLSEDQVCRIRLDQEDIPQTLKLDRFSGIIVGGGPGCVSDPLEKKSETEARIEQAVLNAMPEIIEYDIPYLGCCYGIGVLAHHLGAKVSKEKYGEEVGTTECSVTSDGRKDPLLSDVPENFGAFVGHKEAVQELPKGCAHLLSSPTCPFQMIRYKENIYATQFHPEADGAEFEARIHIYKHRGYFPPEDADRLIKLCRSADIHAPETILRNFVNRYTDAA